MKIIFMGTSSFAVPIAEKLILHPNFKVVAIFTSEPKASGRGMKVIESPIFQLAEKYSIVTHHPRSLKKEESYNLINEIEADIVIVAAYGLIIPERILQAKKYGAINVHPSILPKYRGPAPMQWALINGDLETGVCIMQMDNGVDTGDILLQQTFALNSNIDYPVLHDFCAELGGGLLIKVLENIANLMPIKQPAEGIFHARKLTKEDGLIYWNDKATNINNKIRGMNPWPGAYLKYKNKIIKILSAEYCEMPHDFQPGTIIDDQFTIACLDGVIKILILQIEGKKPLSIKEFLNGNIISPNSIIC